MPSDKLLAEWFWTDRWMGSSGFLLPLEARGLYREMLTQSWRRGASLPANYEMIRRACGVTVEEWNRCWPLVEPYWVRAEDGKTIHNETQAEVYEKTVSLAEARSEAGRIGGLASAEARSKQTRNDRSTTVGTTVQANTQAKTNALSLSLSLSPSKSPEPSQSPKTNGVLAEFDDEFWPNVPNKIGKGKARDAYKAARKTASKDAILSGLTKFRIYEDGRKKQPDYRPLHPTTWLNGERWDDEVVDTCKRRPGDKANREDLDALFEEKS